MVMKIMVNDGTIGMINLDEMLQSPGTSLGVCLDIMRLHGRNANRPFSLAETEGRQ